MNIERKLIAYVITLLALAGCDQKAFFEKWIPKEEADFSKSFVALLQDRDFASIEAKLDPSLKDEKLRGTWIGWRYFSPRADH